VEDLWIRARGDYRFLRLTYRNPLKRYPEPSDFIGEEPVPVAPTWVDEDFPPPNKFSIDNMNSAFPKGL
jgi:hypothetical protein